MPSSIDAPYNPTCQFPGIGYGVNNLSDLKFFYKMSVKGIWNNGADIQNHLERLDILIEKGDYNSALCYINSMRLINQIDANAVIHLRTLAEVIRACLTKNMSLEG